MIDIFIPLALFDASSLFSMFAENANYWFVFVFMVIESSFIPFPSEIVVPPAAYFAATRGDISVVGIVAVATAGAIVGALINYGLSLWIGRPLVYKFANSRFGHACLIDQAKVEKAEQYFDKHGAISTFIGRLIPAVRQLISIPAGLSRMNIFVFICVTGLGALVWNCILAAIGWSLSSAVPLDQLYETVERYNGYLTWAGVGIALLCIAFIAYRFFSHKKQEQ